MSKETKLNQSDENKLLKNDTVAITLTFILMILFIAVVYTKKDILFYSLFICLFFFGWLIQYLHSNGEFKKVSNEIIAGFLGFMAGEAFEKFYSDDFLYEAGFALFLILVYYYVPKIIIIYWNRYKTEPSAETLE